MDDQSKPENSSSLADNYILSRTFSANSRLVLQHYLWKHGVNYLLHPSIPTSSENLKVAEIGVGTGIWLLELARTLPPSAQLDGLDISFAQCPPQEWQPPNISRLLVDCTMEPPTRLCEKYDVIHVQLFTTIIRNGDPLPVLRNLMKILKPGGYISWGEWDYATWKTIRTSSASTQANKELDELLEYTSTMGKTMSGPSFISSGWVSCLHQTFADVGLTDILVDRRPLSNDMTTFVMDAFMVASEEISYNVLDALGDGRGDVARSLIAEVSRNRDTTAFNLDRVTTVARKPEA